MNPKVKLAILVIGALIMIGSLIYDFTAGHVGYRTIKVIGVVIIFGYMGYTYFSSNRESEL
ncbi:hypothetical protein GLV98_06660 [Halobacillus litoralis]|uniref:Uncharacterized protein n=1 Tax=Halobacillus litoralis TaxID=45668 RepID=A0A845E0B4_9BACI|nr:hypothetical protein [Halobacillus litoralis]MYL49157.1 hypothetical protein [Halobacillus litoralis]